MSELTHRKSFTAERLVHTHLYPCVCFSCRKSFRRPAPDGPRKCQECGGPTICLSRKFKAPKKDDLNGWRVVEHVVKGGFLYQSIHLESGGQATYPRTMKEAEEFVRQYGKGGA